MEEGMQAVAMEVAGTVVVEDTEAVIAVWAGMVAKRRRRSMTLPPPTTTAIASVTMETTRTVSQLLTSTRTPKTISQALEVAATVRRRRKSSQRSAWRPKNPSRRRQES